MRIAAQSSTIRVHVAAKKTKKKLPDLFTRPPPHMFNDRARVSGCSSHGSRQYSPA